jgi:hypothetical protein
LRLCISLIKNADAESQKTSDQGGQPELKASIRRTSEITRRSSEWASSHLNVTICMTQGPEEVKGAVALLLPAVVTTSSSAISPSGEVMIRDVNPLPPLEVCVATVFAPKMSSFATVVVAAPLFVVALFPLAPAVTSSVLTPRYSRTRMSGYTAAWLNVTVTVLLPPTMFAA